MFSMQLHCCTLADLHQHHRLWLVSISCPCAEGEGAAGRVLKGDEREGGGDVSSQQRVGHTSGGQAGWLVLLRDLLQKCRNSVGDRRFFIIYFLSKLAHFSNFKIHGLFQYGDGSFTPIFQKSLQRDFTKLSQDHTELSSRLKEEQLQKEQLRRSSSKVEDERNQLGRAMEKLQKEVGAGQAPPS